MADDKFSLDDLLNEYSEPSDKSAGMSLNLDEVLRSIEAEEQKYITRELAAVGAASAAQKSAPQPVIPDPEPFNSEMEERRMDLIRREIISGDYEHKYLGEDFKDVIEEEKRRKAERLAQTMTIRDANDDYDLPEYNTAPIITPDPEPILKMPPKQEAAPAEMPENAEEGLSKAERKKLEKQKAAEEKQRRKEEKAKKKSKFKAEDDEFQRKYEELTRKGLGVKSRSERERSEEANEAFDAAVEEMTKKQGPGRTFSDKMEQDGGYEPEEEPHHRRVQAVFSEKTGLFSYTQEGISDEEIHTGDDPLDSITGDSINKFVNEYEKSKSKSIPTSKENTGRIDNMIDKLMKPDDEATRLVGGNADLMGRMEKLKQERLSKTANIPPIERKSITDIDLKLDDKIIPDTAPITMDKEHAEMEKLRDLRERRSKKIKDFVLSGDEEDSDLTEEDNQEPQTIEDFENMDDAMSIANDIAQLKGSMAIRLLVLIICFAISLYITLANEMNAPIPSWLSMKSQPATYLFVNTLLGLGAAFASYTVLSSGFAKLFSLKADCDSVSAVTITSSLLLSMISIASITDTNLVRDGIVHEYVPLGIGVLIFNTVGKLLILDRTQRNFKYVSGDSEHYAMFMINSQDEAEVFTRGALTDFPQLTTMRKTEMLSDFMKISYSADSSDRFCRIFLPIILAASLLIGLIAAATGKSAYGTGSVFVGLSAFVGCLSLCSCFSMMLVVNLPMHKASKKYREMQGAMIGFDSIDEFSDTNSVMVDASLLFPKGSVTLSNLKIFSDTRIDEAIVEAASLASQSGSIMKNMFYDIIAGKTEMLNPVESYIYEDSMGLCGWINNKRVLLGNRKLMNNHSIEGLPSPAKEKEYTGGSRIPVYLSISGELSAMFIIEATPMPEVVNALHELERNHIKVILRTVDSAITVDRMAEMFDISPDTLKLIPFSAHSDFEKTTSYVPKQSATLACSGRFAAFAALILGTKRIRGTISAGIAMQAVSILLGILLAALMVLLKSFTELSVAMILVYNLVFAVLYMLVNLFRKV